MTPIERVELVLHDFLNDGLDIRSAAIRCIEAMRKITPEMSDAAFQIEASGHSQRTLCEAAFRAMIDAAIEE